jgi:hypothetical protein
MDVGWILGFFFIFVFIVFLAIAFFLPEWVGITGKRAGEIQKHQESASEPGEKSDTTETT